MSLVLHVDGDRWRTHLSQVAEASPGLVPVAKGNGYGLGIRRLARRAQWLANQGLGIDTLAVGTYAEIDDVARRFDGDLVVLSPWRPWDDDGAEMATNERVIHTVGRLSDLAALTEAERLMTDVVAAGFGTPGGGAPVVWISHVSADDLATLAARYPDFTFRPRIGTDLWLGDRGALRVGARVLDSHPVERGEVFGYRGRTLPRTGTLLVVSGGTAHGIGLEAPTGEGSVRARAATLARGGLDALGMVKSPYVVAGKARYFAEPPHMQSSMLFLPSGVEVPATGDEVDVRVRFTATTFDRVEIV